jgi:hypothetical protein
LSGGELMVETLFVDEVWGLGHAAR